MTALQRAGARRWWTAAAAALVLVVAAGVWVRARSAGPPPLAGAVLTPPVHAYDFQLPDPNGRMIRLSDFRGKVVALTFLYTHCRDYCPLIAEQLHAVHASLGAIAGRTALVAVSVDPAGDTPESIRTFLTDHHVAGELTYLRGTAAQLRPVWAHYFVGSDAKTAPSASAGAGGEASSAIGHTTIVYVIDPAGQARVFLPANFDPKDLVTDVRLLAKTAR